MLDIIIFGIGLAFGVLIILVFAKAPQKKLEEVDSFPSKVYLSREIMLWLKPENFKVVGFYPYTSIVTNRILSQGHNHKTPEHDFVEEFGSAIKMKAEDLKCPWDNKVVCEIALIDHMKNSNNSNLFIGYKDGIISIGLGIWQPDSWTAKENKKFL